ncbi:hypothetical protein [Prauserella muralis]|uniref:Uncharacterized protein n=1 Tax=Prauserella muralis TaxID=588067 RepID=A0A2V4AT66_9PSEU|nr:hypothetical protein [Prauserella muralis]PXY24620.1 hypothetical protein BAY60_19065 [Prauserella muralis]TWE27696.1 hypothetical protein FHX69_0340 [Prauserella muralis]
MGETVWRLAQDVLSGRQPISPGLPTHPAERVAVATWQHGAFGAVLQVVRSHNGEFGYSEVGARLEDGDWCWLGEGGGDLPAASHAELGAAPGELLAWFSTHATSIGEPDDDEPDEPHEDAWGAGDFLVGDFSGVRTDKVAHAWSTDPFGDSGRMFVTVLGFAAPEVAFLRQEMPDGDSVLRVSPSGLVIVGHFSDEPAPVTPLDERGDPLASAGRLPG